MQGTYTFHVDPGHGWLEVPVSDVLSLGLTPGMFSQYSYRKGSFLFLEEDADAAFFILAYQAAVGSKPRFSENYTHHNSPIRAYTSLAGEDYTYEKMGERIRRLDSIINAKIA